MARLARLVRTVVNLAENVLDDQQPEPVNLGDGGYADSVYIGLALREATTDTYDEVVDRVATTPRLLAALDLDDELAGAPAPSTSYSTVKRSFGDLLRSQWWYRKFREIVLTFAISNIEQLCDQL